MNWHQILIGAGGVLAIPVIGIVFTTFLPRDKTKEWGRSCGRFCSNFLNQKLGKPIGEALEGRIETTVSDFTVGLIEGMSEDDEPVKES